MLIFNSFMVKKRFTLCSLFGFWKSSRWVCPSSIFSLWMTYIRRWTPSIYQNICFSESIKIYFHINHFSFWFCPLTFLENISNFRWKNYSIFLESTAKRILERFGIQISSSFFKIFIPEFKASFLFFGVYMAWFFI